MKKINRIMMGMLLGSGVLASGAANASAYAVSTNSITGFTVAFDATKAKLSGYTFAGDTATLDSAEVGYGALRDAEAACVDCVFDNSFFSHGAGSSYAYGDTLISNSSVAGGTGAASSIGEVSVLGAGTGHGYGINTLTGTLNVSSPTAVTFSFSATPFMQAMVSGSGDFARAYSSMSISLVKGGVSVFDWAPPSLNQSISPSNGSLTFDPGTSYFTMATGALLTGNYTLSVSMKNDAEVVANPVPVPAAAWLLGSGLIGLAGVARARRKSVQTL